jgi:hypothetical protein
MEKKAEVNQVFIFLIIAAVIVVIILFGFAQIQQMIKSVQEAEMQVFANQLTKDIEFVSLKKGSQTFTYTLPNSVKSIVFLDSSYKTVLMENLFIKKNPIIYDALESDQKMNMFLMSKSGKLLKSFYIGEIEVGQFGDQACSGVGKIDATLSKIRIRITNKYGTKLFIGDECSNIKNWMFQGKFNETSINNNPYAQVSDDKRSIMIKEDIANSLDYEKAYFRNITIFTNNMNLNYQKKLDRIFFSVDEPENTSVDFQIGFQKPDGSREYLGPNITARNYSLIDPKYFNYEPDNIYNDNYYKIYGMYLTMPSYNYSDMNLKIYMTSNPGKNMTPVLRWVKITYFEEEVPPCTAEGESMGYTPGDDNNIPQCCPGLKTIQVIDDNGIVLTDKAYCTKCGDNVCKQPENKHNCNLDCH